MGKWTQSRYESYHPIGLQKNAFSKNAEEFIIYKIFRHWTSKFNRNELSHEIFFDLSNFFFLGGEGAVIASHRAEYLKHC